MKRLWILFSSVLALVLALSLFSCGSIDKECGHTDKNTVKENEVAATCTLSGSYDEVVYCKACGEELSREEKSTPALGHNELTDARVEPTCTSVGKTEGKSCSRCDEVLVEQADIPKTAHSYDNKDDADCNVCGFVRDVNCAHTDTETAEGREPTCTTDGYTSYEKCNLCEEILSEYKELPALGHDEVSHEAKTPTCTEGGNNAYVTCSRCDYTTYSELPALGHSEITDEAKAPTCTEDGTTEGKSCSVCGTVLVESVAVPALGHNFEDGKCTVCGAENYVASEGLLFEEIDSDTCYVAGIGTCADENIVIPKTAPDGRKVVGIGEAAFKAVSAVKSVVIPEGVTYLGYRAFASCSNLSSVTVPETVTKVGERAFEYCSSLLEISIPASTKEIGEYCFFYCTSLKSATLGDGLLAIEESLFNRCASLESVTFGDGIKSIGYMAFADCVSLRAAVMPKGVSTLEEAAFFDCSSLTELKLGEEITVIGPSAFYGCESLASLELPDSLLEIGESAFSGCSSFPTLRIPDSVTTIGKNAFYCCSGIKDITLGSKLATIGEYAFYLCFNITSIEIPSSVTLIETGAFSSCKKLVEVINKSTLNINKGESDNGEVAYNAKLVHKGPSEIERVDDYLFVTADGVNYLVAYYGEDVVLTLPESYKGGSYEINANAFYSSQDIISVEIPAAVTKIGTYAFSICYRLAEIVNNSAIDIKIGSYNSSAVADYAKTVHTGKSLVKKADGFYFITEDGVNYLLTWERGVSELVLPESFDGENYAINAYAFHSRDELVSVVIPDSVTEIGEEAFNWCDNLVSVTLGGGVELLGLYSFSGSLAIEYNVYLGGCYLGNESNPYFAFIMMQDEDNATEAKIHPDTKVICDGAFSFVNTLQSVELPMGIKRIGDETFYYCKALETLVIPSGVSVIGENAFASSGLKTIVIPSGVSVIGEEAFAKSGLIKRSIV